MFCTADLASPAEVSPEKHSTGGVSASFGQAEEICKRGHYCLDGVMALCPAGTFGETEGLKEVSCSGSCPAGIHRSEHAAATKMSPKIMHQRFLFFLGWDVHCMLKQELTIGWSTRN